MTNNDKAIAPRQRTPTGFAAINAAKTHCCHGHSLDDAYIYVDPGGGRHRMCRHCRLAPNRPARRRSA